MRRLLLFLSLTLGGCAGQGNWIPTIWGGDALEAQVLDGDCTVTVDAFVVSIIQGAMLTSEGTAAAVLPGGQLFDLVPPGPQSMASVDVRKGVYPESVYFLSAATEAGPNAFVGNGQLVGLDNAASDANPILGNATGAQRDAMVATGASLLTRGTIACLTKNAPEPVPRAFDWALADDDAILRCPSPDLEVVGGAFGASVLHVRGEALFADPQALWDAGGDGAITLDQLASVWLLDDVTERLRGLFAMADACSWEAVELGP